MTPGAYLRLCREAAGLSIEAVAAKVSTDPRWPEHGRADWIAAIEAGAPTSGATIAALRSVFRFDVAVLEALESADLYPAGVPAICRRCGCTDRLACPGRCWWAEPDLCSACVDPVAQVDAIHAIAAGERPS